METYGADIVRLWTATVDATEDHRIGDEILKGVAEQYRKLRNTLRYLLGALDGFDDAERVPVAEMPELERWVLHRLTELDAELRRAVADFDFNGYVTTISTFVNNDLSAFVFDIRKDSLYCDGAWSPKRRAYRTVLDVVFDALVKWLAPVLVFTTEEAWGTRFPDAESVHLAVWPEVDTAWRDEELAARWERLRVLRQVVTNAIEPLRRDKRIGSSNEAQLTLFLSDAADIALARGVDLSELAITGRVKIEVGSGPPTAFSDDSVHHVEVVVEPSLDPRCERCWRHRADVDPATGLDARCAEVVARG